MAVAGAFKIKCPSCESMVLIRDPSMVGKKVDCPKCKFRFVIEAPAESAEAAAGASAAKAAAVGTAAKGKAKTTTAPKPVVAKPADGGESESGGEKKKVSKKTLYIGGAIGLLAIIVLIIYFTAFGGDDAKPTPAAPRTADKGAGAARKTNPAKTADPKAATKDVSAEAAPPQPEKPIDPVAADLTNLLPENSQLVMRVDGKAFLDTPIGAVFFGEGTESAPAFQRSMGFSGNDIGQFIGAVTSEGAFFGVLHLNADLKFDALKGAMELEPAPKVILKRELWTVKSNDLFTMLGEYLGQKIHEYGLPVPKPAGTRTVGLTLIDPRTLVVGDVAGLELFLQADMKRKHQMLYYSPASQAGSSAKIDEKDKDKKDKDKKGDTRTKTAKKTTPKKEEAAPPPKDDPRPFTSNPSFLSVDPQLKTIINQLDTERQCVLTLALKIPDGERPGVNLFKRFGPGVGVDVIALPKTPVVGVAVRRMDEAKLDAAAAIEYPNSEEVLAYVQNLNIGSQLATALTAAFKVPVRSTGVPPAPMPGQPIPKRDPNAKVDPSAALAPSTVSITCSDHYLVIALDIDWKPVYNQRISGTVRSKVDLLKGEAMMMTGRAYWHALPAAIDRIVKSPAIPPAAFPRPVDSSRFGVPYRPQERVSWMAEMLPFLGYEGLSRKIKRDRPWNYENHTEGDSNLLAGSAWIPEFLSHNSPPSAWRAHVVDSSGRTIDLGATNFVGITGVGLDAGNYPDTPEFAKKLGLFGNERQTKIADVVAGDGLANTIFMIEVPATIQRPWIRGGGVTAQGVPETGSIKPFVCAARDGKRGTNVLMADGSIRFITESISDEVFKALATYKGGEKVDNLDAIAPPEKMDAALKAAPSKGP